VVTKSLLVEAEPVPTVDEGEDGEDDEEDSDQGVVASGAHAASHGRISEKILLLWKTSFLFKLDYTVVSNR
jgi:hypothetical protein